MSSLVPVERIKLITSLDIVLVALMFLVIARTFGVQTMLFALLFFLCTFSGRWPILGQSLLRFDWLAALVSAVCMLKARRHGWAGGLLTYAGLNRVFPAIFMWPYLVGVVTYVIRKRRFAEDHLRFILGSLIVQAVLILGSLVSLGPGAFVDAKDNLMMHASPQSYSSHRVGLGDALFYRGETNRRDLNREGGIAAKADKIGQYQGLLYGLGIGSLVLIAVYVVRTRKSAFALTYLAIIPLYCMQNPQINYYNMRLLCVLAHMHGIHRLRHKLGLILLFIIECITQYSHVEGNWRYTTTCMTSIGLAIYFAGILVFLVRDLAQGFGHSGGLSEGVSQRGGVGGELDA